MDGDERLAGCRASCWGVRASDGLPMPHPADPARPHVSQHFSATVDLLGVLPSRPL